MDKEFVLHLGVLLSLALMAPANATPQGKLANDTGISAPTNPQLLRDPGSGGFFLSFSATDPEGAVYRFSSALDGQVDYYDLDGDRVPDVAWIPLNRILEP